MHGEHPLKTYRIARKQSQERLADELGVSRMTVLRWENRQSQIGHGLLAKVESKTGIPAKELRPDLAELLGGSQ